MYRFNKIAKIKSILLNLQLGNSKLYNRSGSCTVNSSLPLTAELIGKTTTVTNGSAINWISLWSIQLHH
jgi:hypothetical protein